MTLVRPGGTELPSCRCEVNGTRSSVTIRIGIAMYPEDGELPEQVVDRADEAMYRAKAAGRNQAVLYCAA